MSPSRKTKKDDDSDRLYKLLGKVIGGMDKKIGDHDSRITKLEDKVFSPVPPVLPKPWKDPKNIRIMLWIVLAAITLALTLMGVDITKVGN